jgi:hypothetical protein
MEAAELLNEEFHNLQIFIKYCWADQTKQAGIGKASMEYIRNPGNILAS